jgi:choline kinase
MSDHIVSISALRRITKYENSNNLLLVDPETEDIYGIDDATKVAYQGSNIIDIGKEITQYNGVDCGIFRLNNRFFKAMNEALSKNQDSISAAIKILIRNKIMEAVFLKQDEKWLDVDTPEAYRYLLENMSF